MTAGAAPSTPEVRFVPLAEAPLDAVLELAREHLGPGALPWTREAWEWKHARNPFGPSSGIVAMAAGRPVALRVFQRWRWRQGGEDWPAARAVDTVTHRDWRGRGLFRRLTMTALDDLTAAPCGAPPVRFVLNTPNRHSRPGYLAMGWRVLGRPRLLVAPRRWPRRRPGAPPPAIDAPRAADWLARREAAAFSATPGALSGLFATDRSLPYLRWRYGQPPGLDYRVVEVGDDEAAAAIVARGRRRFGLGEVTVAEVLVRGGTAATPRLTAALRELGRRAAGADHLLALAPPPEWAPAFRRAGFLPLGHRGPLVTVRALSAGAAPLPPLAHWRFAAGDLEVF